MKLFLQQFLLQLRVENKSLNTIYNYKLSLNDYLSFLFEVCNVESVKHIDKIHIRTYLRVLSKTGSYLYKGQAKKKIITVIEPHRFSRLECHLNDFIDSLSKSDSIFILPVYSAGEKDIKKIDSLIFSKLLSKKFKNKFISLVKNEIIFFKTLKKIISPGDNIIFLGAGKSAAVAERFCKYSGLD